MAPGPSDSPAALDTQARASDLRQRLPLVVVLVVAVAALAASGVLYGTRGLVTPLAAGLLLSLPGDLARRALGMTWPTTRLGITVTNASLSFGVLVVLGSPLLATGNLTAGAMTGALVIAAVVALVPIARRRPRPSDGWVTVIAAIAVVGVFALGMLTLELRPYIGSRISLGQYEGALIIAEEAEIPETQLAYDVPTDFPIHYLFFDLATIFVLELGDHDGYDEQIQLLASMRVAFIALFAAGWYLAGRLFLRLVLGRRRTWAWVAGALPLLLVLNRVYFAKFREPLTEGLGIAFLGVGFWALLAATDGVEAHRRSATIVSAVALGVIPGISLPALAGAAFVIAPWVIVTTVNRTSAREPGEPRSRAWLSSGWAVALGPVIGLVLFDRLGRGALSDLLGGSLDTAVTDPGQSLRASLMLIGRQLSTETAQDAVASAAGVSRMFVNGAAWGVLIILGVLAVLSFGAWGRSRWRWLGWIALTTGLLLIYSQSAVVLATDEVTPWRTMTRSAFYVWTPIALGLLVGLANAVRLASDALPRGGQRPSGRTVLLGLGAGLLAFAAGAFSLARWADTAATVRDHGWLQESQISDDGHAALRWIAANVPADARILTSEVTYGSALAAERHIVTEGKGTIEDAIVTGAALDVVGGAIEFFVAARDPRVLTRYDVSHVLAPNNGASRAAQIGGQPMLRQSALRVERAAPTALADLPYLSPIHSEGAVTLYEVDLTAIPSVQDDGVHLDESSLGPCRADMCIARIAIPEDGCRREQVSNSPDECLVVRGPTKELVDQFVWDLAPDKPQAAKETRAATALFDAGLTYALRPTGFPEWSSLLEARVTLTVSSRPRLAGDFVDAVISIPDQDAITVTATTEPTTCSDAFGDAGWMPTLVRGVEGCISGTAFLWSEGGVAHLARWEGIDPVWMRAWLETWVRIGARGT